MEATKGSATEQRTKVGEFPLGRDKEGERGQRGETERRRRSRRRSGGRRSGAAPAMVLKIFAD